MSHGGCTLVWLLLAALSFVLVLAVTTALKLRANRVLQVACLPSAPEAEPAPVGAEFVENLALTGLSDTELAARRIAKTPLGELGLQMGCIFAADLLVDPERQAFSRVVSPDSYLSTLHRARDLVAVAEWRLAEGQPRRWALALLPGQALRTLKADEVFGYPVDAVFGPFMNVAGQAAFLTRDQRG